MKKMSGALAAVCLLAVSVIFMSCDHIHTYSDEWTSDESYHWHAATCEHADEIADKAEHTFGDWNVVSEATEDSTGEKERTCTICGYKECEVIEELSHTHTFSTEWTSDGTYHWHAATCEHTKKVSDKAEHTFGEWSVTKSATTEAEGEKSRKCSICGYADTDTIEKIKTFKVTYETDNGTVPDEITVEDGTKLTADQLPSLTADGFTFDGWYIGETKVEADYEVTEDVTLTAKWTKIEDEDPETPVEDDDSEENETEATEEAKNYKVEYITALGSVKAITVDKGAALTAEQLPELTADGYIFDGWYISGTKIEAGYKVTANIKLTAKWTEIEITGVKGITVTVNNEDDPVTDDDSIEVSWILDGSYILFTAPSGYSEYQWTFMDVISTTSYYKYQLYIHDNNPGVYPIYLYIPDAKKSATIYFTFTKE